MNTYIKYLPNVFVAKCPEPHEKGETILLTTKRGKEVECVVFNKVLERDGFFYYSIVRADGFNKQEWAKRRADRLARYAENASKKSDHYFEASNQHRDFLSLGEPIKVGHHSEKKHRRIIEQANTNMRRSVEFDGKAKDLVDRSKYWESRAGEIDLSMPESLEYYEYELAKAKELHEGMKSGTVERSHGYSLTYAKKRVNDLEKKVKYAKLLWHVYEAHID